MARVSALSTFSGGVVRGMETYDDRQNKDAAAQRAAAAEDRAVAGEGRAVAGEARTQSAFEYAKREQDRKEQAYSELDALNKQSPDAQYAAQQSDYTTQSADWKNQYATGAPSAFNVNGAVGPVPPAPVAPQAPSMGSRLQHNLKVADVMLNHRMIDPAAYQNLQSGWNKIQKEGVVEALQAADGGDPVAAGKLFNGTGDARSQIGDPRTTKKEVQYRPMGDPNAPMMTGYEYTLPDGSVIKPHELLGGLMSYKDKMASVDKLAQTKMLGESRAATLDQTRAIREGNQAYQSDVLDERRAARREKDFNATIGSVYQGRDAELQAAVKAAELASKDPMDVDGSKKLAADKKVTLLHNNIQRDIIAVRSVGEDDNTSPSQALTFVQKLRNREDISNEPKTPGRIRAAKMYMEPNPAAAVQPPQAASPNSVAAQTSAKRRAAMQESANRRAAEAAGNFERDGAPAP